MGRLLIEIGFVMAMLAGLGLAGGFAIIPLRRRMPFAILAAPFAGILCVSLGIAGLYSLAGWSFGQCAAVSVVACSIASLISIASVRAKLNGRDLGPIAVMAIVAIGVVTWTSEATTIHFRGPGLLYTDGTDALGYAHMADWLMAHRVGDPPAIFNPPPYQTWPAYLFRVDPRFGSFFFLALIAKLRHVSGAFAYDAACAVVLSAAVLGVATVFARSWHGWLMLLAGLTCSYWYEHSRSGFFGKTLGYPAALFVIGVFVLLPDDAPLGAICLAGILVCGAALMHSGLAMALFFVAAAVPFLIARYVFERDEAGRRTHLQNRVIVALLLAGLAILTSGVIARPLKTDFPDWHLSLGYMLPRMMDVEYLGPPGGVGVSGMSPRLVDAATAAVIVIWLVLAGAAIVRREPVAIGLLIGPLLLAGGLIALRNYSAAFQLTGFIYPSILCGAATLLEDTAEEHPRAGWATAKFGLATAMMLLLVALQIPRYTGSVRRYVTSLDKMQRFSLAQTEKLASAIGPGPVEVDITSPTHAIFVLVELGRRHVHLRWTPESWETVLSYSHRPAPPFEPAPYRLQLAQGPVPTGWRVVCRAMPFRLLRRR